MMLLPLVFGLAIVLVLALLPWLRARRLADQEAEARMQAMQDRQSVIDFMHLMAEALGEGLSRQELQQRIVHASILCTGALSACFFEETERKTMRAAAVEGLFPPHRPIDEAIRAKLTTRARFIEQVLKAEEFPVGEGIVGRVARTRRGELLADAVSDPLIVKHDDPALAVRSVIAVPLQFRGSFFGVLAVTNPAGDRPFGELEFSLMISLAEQAALALHNAEGLQLQLERKQLDLDLSVARGIQQMLLPRQTTEFPGLDIDARYLPAQQVGGDLFDVIPLPEGRVGIAVADVSGKGIPASLLMAICRTHLRQIAPRFTSPAEALKELNRVISGDLHTGYYITLTYAVVDAARGQVTFARAGHEQPLLAHGASYLPVEFLPSEGMPLGLVGEEEFAYVIADRTMMFNAGDCLVLYTDGVTEAPNDDGKEFSGARLMDAVRTLRAKSARELNDGILASVRHFTSDTPQRDDFTLVTVKRR